MKKQYKYLIVALAVLIVVIGCYLVIKSSKPAPIVKTPFGVTQTAVYFYPSITSIPSSNNTVTLIPQFYDDIAVVIGNTIGWTDTDRRIKKLSINNIKMIQEPKLGGFSLFKPTNDPKNPFNTNPKYNITNTRRYDIAVLSQNINTNFLPDSIGELGGIVHLYYYSNSFKSITKPKNQTIDFPTVMKELGISNDDLKAKIAFDLQVTNKKDQTFVKHLEFNLPVSDINNLKTYSTSNLTDADKNMFNVK